MPAERLPAVPGMCISLETLRAAGGAAVPAAPLVGLACAVLPLLPRPRAVLLSNKPLPLPRSTGLLHLGSALTPPLLRAAVAGILAATVTAIRSCLALLPLPLLFCVSVLSGSVGTGRTPAHASHTHLVAWRKPAYCWRIKAQWSHHVAYICCRRVQDTNMRLSPGCMESLPSSRLTGSPGDGIGGVTG